MDSIIFLLCFDEKQPWHLTVTYVQEYNKEIRQLIKWKSVTESNINMIYSDTHLWFDFHEYLCLEIPNVSSEMLQQFWG